MGILGGHVEVVLEVDENVDVQVAGPSDGGNDDGAVDVIEGTGRHCYIEKRDLLVRGVGQSVNKGNLGKSLALNSTTDCPADPVLNVRDQAGTGSPWKEGCR